MADVLVDGVSSDVWHRWGQGTPAQVSLCPLYGTDIFQYQGPIPFDVDVDLSARGSPRCSTNAPAETTS